MFPKVHLLFLPISLGKKKRKKKFSKRLVLSSFFVLIPSDEFHITWVFEFVFMVFAFLFLKFVIPFCHPILLSFVFLDKNRCSVSSGLLCCDDFCWVSDFYFLISVLWFDLQFSHLLIFYRLAYVLFVFWFKFTSRRFLIIGSLNLFAMVCSPQSLGFSVVLLWVSFKMLYSTSFSFSLWLGCTVLIHIRCHRLSNFFRYCSFFHVLVVLIFFSFFFFCDLKKYFWGFWVLFHFELFVPYHLLMP